MATGSPPSDSHQPWDPENYARTARFVAELGEPVIALLAPQAGERILDLGCGDGALTAKLAATGAQVVGVDSSPELAAAARAHGLDVRVGDGQRLTFSAEFDAVFSNAALHWMTAPDAVLAGVRRALRPGGRFVGEFGGHGNVAAICTALMAVLNQRGTDGAARFPWYFPTAEEYVARLAAHGFTVQSVVLLPRPTRLPTGMTDWLRTFANPFLAGLDGTEREAGLAAVTDLLAPSLRDRAGQWTADYVRLRFVAHLIE